MVREVFVLPVEPRALAFEAELFCSPEPAKSELNLESRRYSTREQR